MRGFDNLDKDKQPVFSRLPLLWEDIGEEGLRSEAGLMRLAAHILTDPDYQPFAAEHPESTIKAIVERILRPAGAAPGGMSGASAGQPITIEYTENAEMLSEKAAPILNMAAKVLKQLVASTGDMPVQDADRVRTIAEFNRRMDDLVNIKGRLASNEVLNLTDDLRNALESRRYSQYFHIRFQDRSHALNLSNLNLQDVNLFGANLSHANFAGSDLSGTNLIQAQLESANFSNALLLGTFLHRARLTNANLMGANLTGAEIQNADLSGANLRRAFFKNAILLNTELAGSQLHFSDIESRLWLAEVHRSLDDEWVKLRDHANGALRYACRYLLEGRGVKLFDDEVKSLDLDQVMSWLDSAGAGRQAGTTG